MGERKSKWLEHLKAAESSGLKLSAYAAQHQIDVRRLYEAKFSAAPPLGQFNVGANSRAHADALAPVDQLARGPFQLCAVNRLIST